MKRPRPNYDLEKIRFGTDGPTFERAVNLYHDARVTRFRSELGGFSATVLGSKPYRVSVSARNYDRGECECYLGQSEVLCKHMVAVAIRAVTGGKALAPEEKSPAGLPESSGRIGPISKEKLAEARRAASAAMRFIKPYDGPSRIWFAYQNSLAEGCGRLAAIISDLPVNKDTADFIVDILLRVDQKLCKGGVDDSDGAVGEFIEAAVDVLKDHAKLDPACVDAFRTLKGRETCFGWEEELVGATKTKRERIAEDKK